MIRTKWRPSLLMVIGGVLGTVLALPFLGLLALRVLKPSLGSEMSYTIVTLMLLGGTAALGLALRRLLLRPIRALSTRTRALAHGETVAPLAHYGTRELRDLGQSVLEMGHILRAREQSVRTYSDHITHELKSPLTAILGATEMLHEGEISKNDARLLDTLRISGMRIENLLTGLRDFAATAEANYAGQSRILDIVTLLKPEFAPLEILCPDFEPRINSEGLGIVLRHLLGNAMAHGASQVTIRPTDSGFEIADNGTGISDDISAQIFHPFFSTRREAGGTGMGLAIVARLIETLGGKISIAPRSAETCFVISLP